MFLKLQKQIQDRFKELCATGNLFYVDINRDDIWEAYLSGWADDPIEQQGHNCNTCKSFLRQYAGIVAIDAENKIMTIWDIVPEDEVYSKSVFNLRRYIKSLPITDVFVSEFKKAGVEKNLDSKNSAVIWNHFYLVLPNTGGYVLPSSTIDTVKGQARDTHQVLKRGLDELTIEATDTVLELIAQNSLYRGKEFEGLLIAFRTGQKEYKNIHTELKNNFVWKKSKLVSESVSRIRNTSIGTLLIDLSAGMELDEAVAKFERVVAPTNYKRPTSLVTPKMVDQAKEVLQTAGYLPSLERRFAADSDLSLSNLLYIDKSSNLKDVFEDMKKDTVVNVRSLSKVEEISIADFTTGVLPKAKAIYALLENSHLNNMVSLITEKGSKIGYEGKNLFKWNNPFSWAYTGGITDSIKEKVKAAGGKVDGELRVSLSWSNYDDLDLHVIEPHAGVIYFRNKISVTGGRLDVDMNAGSGTTRTPVENIVWPKVHAMEDGKYAVKVHNYAQRESEGTGFQVQIECRGEVFDFDIPYNPKNKHFHNVVEFHYSRSKGITMPPTVLSSGPQTKEKWNLKTNRFHKVKHIMPSPNTWDGGKVGNQHLFFTLENCASDEQTRPFFNEFLKEELNTHRKFFEILGGKLLLSPTTSQVAGLGFSETQHNHLYVKVEGTFKRILKINF